MRHEIVLKNPDVEVRFYLSVDKGSYVTPHWHDSLEMIYMLKGSITIMCDNRKRVLKPGEFAVVNSRAIHSVLSTDNQALVLQIPKETFALYVSDIDLYRFEVNMHPETEADRTRLEKMKKLFQDMYIVYDIRPERYLLRFYSLLFELLFMLVHSYSRRLVKKELDRNNKYLDRLKEVILYINEHHKEKCLVSDLARLFGYNEDYLARIFKKYTGMTIVDYLYAVRITEVYRELMQTDKSIQKIFEAHGCTNQRVAMRVFREMYGCTPNQKRKQKNSESDQ